EAPDLIAGKLASVACKAAVKGNHRMSQAEAAQMIDDLMRLENPYFCPHGRPVIIAMTRQEIERKFKRIV
ncbi:MAG: DNA mismatch repair protein MutL, partial [Clostridiales bacterium]|nr:DNA mismatch repair protein MutL [Clostridiales bacterium]